jgi:cytochrome P450
MKPPKPEPRSSYFPTPGHFLRFADSWIDTLTVKSYRSFMGRSWLPSGRVFVINDPQWVSRVLIQDAKLYPKHRIFHQIVEPLIGSTVFSTNGAEWQRQRRFLDQAFVAAKVAQVFPLMQQACEDWIQRLFAHPEGQPCEVDKEMTQVTADIIHRTMFSEPLSGEAATTLFNAFADYQKASQRLLVLRLFSLPHFGLRWLQQRAGGQVRRYFEARLRERITNRPVGQEVTGKDIVAGLRQATDPEGGPPMEAKEILDHLCMLFLAGHETSASALSWAFYILALEASLQEQLRAEVDAVWGDGPLTIETLKNMEQLQAFFREVLRLYPPVGQFIREASHEHEIRGAKVKPGDMLVITPWLLHRHERWWRDPDEFQQQRFGPSRTDSPIRGSYLPFSLGIRACSGAAFAQQEALLILAYALKTHLWSPVPGATPKVVGRLTVRPEPGVSLNIQRRQGVSISRSAMADTAACTPGSP